VKVRAQGMALSPEPGWEVRIRVRPADPGAADGRPRPVLHAATVPLPEGRGDFGGGVTALLGPEDVFLTLFEYDPAASTTALFATRGRPTPIPPDFSPSQLQRTLPGQSGRQWFFREGGRAFCLYVVLGSHARRVPLVRRAAALLATLDLDPGDGS
jgi:hypothetical protein